MHQMASVSDFLFTMVVYIHGALHIGCNKTFSLWYQLLLIWLAQYSVNRLWVRRGITTCDSCSISPVLTRENYCNKKKKATGATSPPILSDRENFTEVGDINKFLVVGNMTLTETLKEMKTPTSTNTRINCMRVT